MDSEEMERLARELFPELLSRKTPLKFEDQEWELNLRIAYDDDFYKKFDSKETAAEDRY